MRYHRVIVLQVANVAQLKYVEDEDMLELGMSKPEMRRLKKHFRRECPQGRLSKLKKVRFVSTQSDLVIAQSVRTCAPVDRSHLQIET